MEPTTTSLTRKKPWYSSGRFLLFAGGLLLGIVVTITIQQLSAHSGKQTRISCHTPTTQNTQTEYCVYYKHNKLLVGPTNSSGLTYAIPYSQDKVSISWDNNTDALTITLPSTKLIVQASEYVTAR